MTTTWITIGFVPTTQPVAVKRQIDEHGTEIKPVAGWMIQHQYKKDQAIPTDSRLIAGVLSEDGQIQEVKPESEDIRVYYERTNDPWITVSFTPATEPFVVHWLNPEGTSTWTQRITGWLTQHLHGEATPKTDDKSRVIAGVLQPELGQVLLADPQSPQFVGVHPAGEGPSTEDIELARDGQRRRKTGP